MKLEISFAVPYVEQDQILDLKCSDLDDFYASASETDRLNLFFVLLNTLHRFDDDRDPEKEAHLCFLIAYYLFVPLTPPGSCSLALHYIKEAIRLNPLPEYLEWLPLIEKGN